MITTNSVPRSAGNRCLESLFQCQCSSCTTGWRRVCNTCGIHVYGGDATLPQIQANCVESDLFTKVYVQHVHLFGKCSLDQRLGSHVLGRSVGCNQVSWFAKLARTITADPRTTFMERLSQNQCWSILFDISANRGCSQWQGCIYNHDFIIQYWTLARALLKVIVSDVYIAPIPEKP